MLTNHARLKKYTAFSQYAFRSTLPVMKLNQEAPIGTGPVGFGDHYSDEGLFQVSNYFPPCSSVSNIVTTQTNYLAELLNGPSGLPRDLHVDRAACGSPLTIVTKRKMNISPANVSAENKKKAKMKNNNEILGL